MKPVNQRAMKRAIWSSLSKVIGVILAAGAGSIIRDVAGDSLHRLGVSAFLALVAWALMLYAEYEREKN